MKTVTVVGGNIHFHNSSWLHRGIIDQSTCTLCHSHQKWHCAFTQRSTEWWDHSSSHITIALDLWPQYVPRSKPPFPFCFWLLANPRSWFVAGSPLVLCSVWRGVLFHFEYWRFWGGNWPLPVAAHVGVVRVERRRRRHQTQQDEPQQGLGGNPTGPHRPRPSVLGEAERHREEDFTFKRCRVVHLNYTMTAIT